MSILSGTFVFLKEITRPSQDGSAPKVRRFTVTERVKHYNPQAQDGNKNEWRPEWYTCSIFSNHYETLNSLRPNDTVEICGTLVAEPYITEADQQGNRHPKPGLALTVLTMKVPEMSKDTKDRLGLIPQQGAPQGAPQVYQQAPAAYGQAPQGAPQGYVQQQAPAGYGQAPPPYTAQGAPTPGYPVQGGYPPAPGGYLPPGGGYPGQQQPQYAPQPQQQPQPQQPPYAPPAQPGYPQPGAPVGAPLAYDLGSEFEPVSLPDV